MKITKATIHPKPADVTMFGPMPTVTATFEDGTEKKLFTYYPDEISFTEAEFVGLTEDEARALRTKKDVEYLQTP